MDRKEAVQRMIEAVELNENFYRIGQSKIFLRTDVPAHLKEERHLNLSSLISNIQAYFQGYRLWKYHQGR